MNYFHMVNGRTEWSGILHYEIIEGSVKNPESLVIKANRMCLMNIGDPAFTSFEYNSEVMDFYDEYPEMEEMSTGLIHTHHEMDSYFSNTDLDELRDNAPLHNYYLSLIVNNKNKFCAKLAIPVVESSFSQKIKDESGNIVEFNVQQSDVIYTIDFTVVLDADPYDVKRNTELAKQKKEEEKESKASSWANNYYGGYNQNKYHNVSPIVPRKKSFELAVEEYLVSSTRIWQSQTNLQQIAESYRRKNNTEREKLHEEWYNNFNFGIDDVMDEHKNKSIAEIYEECLSQINELAIQHKSYKEDVEQIIHQVFNYSYNEEEFDEEEEIQKQIGFGNNHLLDL